MIKTLREENIMTLAETLKTPLRNSILAILLSPKEQEEIKEVPSNLVVAMYFEASLHIKTLHTCIIEAMHETIENELPDSQRTLFLTQVSDGLIEEIDKKRSPKAYALAELIHSDRGFSGADNAFSFSHLWLVENCLKPDMNMDRMSADNTKISEYSDIISSLLFDEENPRSAESILSKRLARTYRYLTQSFIYMPYLPNIPPEGADDYLVVLQAYATFRSQTMGEIFCKKKEEEVAL